VSAIARKSNRTSIAEQTDSDQRPRRERASYAEAGTAMREATRRLAAIRCTAKTANYVSVAYDVIVQVGSYSRTSDNVSRADVAARLGVSEDTVGRAMKWASDLGVFDWRKQGTKWLLTLPEAENPTPHIVGDRAASTLPEADDPTPHDMGESAVSDAANPPMNCGAPRRPTRREQDGGRVAVDHDDGDEPLTDAETLDLEVGHVMITALRWLGAPLDRIEREFRARPEKVRQLDKRVSRLVKSGIEGHDLLLMLTDRDAPRHEVETYVGLLLSRSRRVQPLKKSRATA
jgi:hypothetical protein